MLLVLLILSAIAYSEGSGVCKLEATVCQTLRNKHNFFASRFKAGKFEEIIDGLYDETTVLAIGILGKNISLIGKSKNEQLELYKDVVTDYARKGLTQLTFSPRKVDSEGKFYVVHGIFKLVDAAGRKGIRGTYYQKFNSNFVNVRHIIKPTAVIGDFERFPGWLNKISI